MSRLGLPLLVLVLLIPAATAATISITPDAIDPGDVVTVDVQSLPDGAAFSLGIRGEFTVIPGERFAFTARNLVLPFSLGSGEVSAYSRGTEWTGLAVQMPDGASVSLSNNADANGEFRTTQAYNISSGTYAAITLDGRAAPTTERVIAEVVMQGVKQGPDDGTISFAVEGIEHGTATVTVYVDGSETLARTIAIGTSPRPPTTQGGGSGSGGSPGSSNGISNGSSTPAPAAGSATVASTDGKVSLTGTDLEDVGLLPLAVEGIVPGGWSAPESAYAVTPEGRVFDPAATLSFRLLSADATATLARYENGAWTPIPSKIGGDRITASVSRAGSYLLLVPVSAAEPAAPVTTTSAPSVTTTPAAAPVTPLLPAIALAILMFGWKRRD